MANLAESASPDYAKFKKAQQLLARYNSGDHNWMMDKDKEMVASIAAQYGLDFKADSKPIRKALFDFADMATFGLLPNKWRPTTIGEEYGFVSGADKMAGAAGTVGGLFTPYGGPGFLMRQAVRGGRNLKNWWNAPKVGSSGNAANKIGLLNRGRDIPLLRQGAPRLGQEAPRLSGRPNLLGMGTRRPPTTGAGETYDIMRGSRLGTGSMNMSPRTYRDYLDNF